MRTSPYKRHQRKWHRRYHDQLFAIFIQRASKVQNILPDTIKVLYIFYIRVKWFSRIERNKTKHVPTELLYDIVSEEDSYTAV